jgi:hypothetical protein
MAADPRVGAHLAWSGPASPRRGPLYTSAMLSAEVSASMRRTFVLVMVIEGLVLIALWAVGLVYG